MPRVLGGINTMVLQDTLSDCEIHLKYRMPTPQEIISYRNGDTKRKRNKIVVNTGANRLEHGLKILKGFRDGDFAKIENGKQVPISSDPKSKNYDEDWKGLVEKQASDLIETLAVQVFDRSSQVVPPEDHENDEDKEDIEQD